MSDADRNLLLASPGARVLLVGSGKYAAGSRLSEIGVVPDTVQDLGRCLVERAGLDPAHLTMLIDPAGPGELGTALVEAAEQATDVLLVYYVGHGLVAADNELHLATHATVDLTKGIAAYQALPYPMLRQALAQCTAPMVVVILDCCFSNRATPVNQDLGQRLLDVTPQGTYLLAAAGRDETAFAPPNRRNTAFTGALIDLLTRGDPTAPAVLTLDDIYRCLARTLREQGLTAPRRQATDHGDRRPVAVNPAHPLPSATRTRPHAEGGHEAPHGDDEAGEFSPYRGLAAFTADDADYFFGRDELIQTLLDRVAAQVTADGPLVVTGPSGSGKSSLLRAGLIAGLRRSPDTEVTLLTPGHDPVGTLATRFAHLAESRPADLRARLEDDPAVLRSVVADAMDDRQAVIIVDQFEELFTACPDERQRRIFIEALRALCRKSADASGRSTASVARVTGSRGGTGTEAAAVVVLGVRADFFGHCAAHEELVPALEQPVVVGPMSPDQLRQAIEGPAQRAGLSLEDGLIELILQDLGADMAPDAAGGAGRGGGSGVGVLPLLSHALLVTWQRREKRMLTMAGYRATGGIHRALARTADTVYGHLDLPARTMARQMLTRLVRLGEGQDDTRRIVPLAELLPRADSAQYANAREALDRFVDARLLVVDAGTVQVAHEALIRAWPRLRLWIDTDRSTLLVHQQLSQDAAEWDRHDRDPAFLYQGTRLTTAQQAVALWRTDPGRYPTLTDLARDFLQASEAAAARQARRRRQTILALAVSLVLALTGAGTAAKLAADATKERARSLSRQLAAQSENVADTNIRLARQLATAAWSVAHTDEARASVLKTLLGPERATLIPDAGWVRVLGFSPDGSRLVTTSGQGITQLWEVPSGKLITTLFADAKGVVSVALSPDATRLATTSEDGTVRLWEAPSGKPIITLDGGRSEPKTDPAFSPDGTHLATGSEDGTVRIWDISTGKTTATLTGHTKPVTDLIFSPDGTHLATSSEDGTVLLWSVATGKNITLKEHAADLTDLAFSPDGTYLATAGTDGTVRLYRVSSGKQVTTLTGHDESVTDLAFVPDSTTGLHLTVLRDSIYLAFSPDSTYLATSSEDNTVRLWEVPSGKLINTLTGHTEDVYRLAFSPDGTHLATTSADNTARLWDITTGKTIATLTGHTEDVTHIAFSPDGTHLATRSEDQTVRLWNVTTGKTIATLIGHYKPLARLAFSPNGTHLATADTDGTVWLWEVPSGKSIAALTRYADELSVLAFSPDGTRLAAASANTVQLYDIAAGKTIATLTGGPELVTDLAFSPGGTRLATASKDGTAALWEVPSGERLTPLRGPLTGDAESLNDVSISPDGIHLATTSDSTVRLWDISTGKGLATLSGHRKPVTSLTFSPDGTRLATASEDGAVRLWQVPSGEPITTLTGHTGLVTDLAFSPDGTRLATASKDGTVRLWSMSSGDPIATLTGYVDAVVFTPDGSRLATAGSDGTTRLWDVPSGEPITTLTGHTGLVTDLAFSPDGTRLATASTDRTARLWNVNIPADPFLAVCALAGGAMSEEEWAHYLPDEPYRKVCP